MENADLQNERQILAQAMAAIAAAGPDAIVQVLINRTPNGRYLKMMKVRTHQGPRGKIVALVSEGTIVEFEAKKLVSFLSPVASNGDKKKLQKITDERVKINPWVSRSAATAIGEIAAARNLSLAAIVDAALSEYVERYA